MENRKEQSIKHHEFILENNNGDIEKAVKHSTVYDEYSSVNTSQVLRIAETDCLSAAIAVRNNDFRAAITILNFASFTKQGGGYMNGARAQEEYLCNESNLWEILNDEAFEGFYNENRKENNIQGGIYKNRAIFTPNVKFHRDGVDYYFNVLTCAAPNYKRAIQNNIPHNVILDEYKSRVRFIYNILHDKHQDFFISGAWGCGVFGFPRDISKRIFEQFATIETILAIPSKGNFENKRSR